MGSGVHSNGQRSSCILLNCYTLYYCIIAQLPQHSLDRFQPAVTARKEKRDVLMNVHALEIC